MRCTSMLHILLACLLTGLATLSTAAVQAQTPQEQMQVQACRAVGSLLLYRGEGFQASYAERVDSDLAALAAAVQSSPQASSELRAAQQILVTQIKRGVSFGPNEEDVPWGYQKELSKSLRDFLIAAHDLAPATPVDELPVKLEYLSVQYLFRSYVGSLELAREHADQYIGQDERLLVPDIDGEMNKLPQQDAAVKKKLDTRWSYLRVALADMNSGVTAMTSLSGRPFAPTIVDRHARAMSDQLMSSN
ncbi:hypothetical protein ACVW0Y_004552 [Pseudomonas sp. TE3786]